MNNCRAFCCGCPGFRIFDLNDRTRTGVDRVIVLLNDCIALLAVRLLGRSFHVFDCLLGRNDVREFEESGLHDRIDTAAHADFFCELNAIDVVELHMMLSNGILHFCREFLLHLFEGPRRVEQECSAVTDAFRNRITGNIGGVMASDKVRLVDQIRALDRLLAKAQMGYRKAAGLLGVIGEIALRIHVGMVADDLDAVLVGADCTI